MPLQVLWPRRQGRAKLRGCDTMEYLRMAERSSACREYSGHNERNPNGFLLMPQSRRALIP